MSKPPPSVAQKSKPGSAAGKKDSKKQAEEELPVVSPSPHLPAVAPFDVLHEVWSLSSLSEQRQRVSALFGLPDCPAGCLCFARVALDDCFQHLRFASALALSPVQARFVHQLVHTFLSALQLPDERWSTADIRDKLRLLLVTNCVELLPGTTYIDSTHLLAPLDLPPTTVLPLAVSDVPPSVATGASLTPATSRPSTASASAAAASKRPPASARGKPAAPPSPQHPPARAGKPLTAKEKEAAAAAERAAAIAAAEAAAAEAAELALLPPSPPIPPPHFLTAQQKERVWQYASERLLVHAEMYRAVYNAEARKRRDAEAGQYVWRRVKEQPEGGWVRPLQQALSEQPVVLQQPTTVEAAQQLQPAVGAAADTMDCELTLQDGEYTAGEREWLLQRKADMEQRLREAAQRQRQQPVHDSKAVPEEKEQSSREHGVSGAIIVK